jgi:ubiquinone/menaquinone biosynthesis C-methylase UbiE
MNGETREQAAIHAIRRMYDRAAERYDPALNGRLGHSLLRDSREKAARWARGRVLDIGVGSGASLPYYAADVRITGIDISPGMLAVGRRRLQELGREGELLLMDAQRLDFPDQSFDSVSFNLCLCTIPDPSRALHEAVRVARPGAPMTFIEHVRSDRWWVALFLDLLNPISSRVAHDRINQRTEELIRAAGIEVLTVERWFLGAMTFIAGRSPSR